MEHVELIVRSRRVVTGGQEGPAAMHIGGGSIVAITAPDQPSAGAEVWDVGDLVVMAGLVDSHVHVNEPGRTEWEGFATATRAAAAGGVTTIVDMPLNSIPPTVSAQALIRKQEAAAGSCAVDVGFWGGIVPGSEEHILSLVEAGVCGFKVFLIDSGVPEFPPLGAAELARVLPLLAELDSPLLVHAELEAPMVSAARRFARLDPAERRHYRHYLESRPPAGEEEAVAMVGELGRRAGGAVHILHLAAASVVPSLQALRAAGARLTAETCPHYLTLAAEEIESGSTSHKCAPPIRTAEHRDGLWAGLADGSIQMVVSDHSPAPPELKATASGDFGEAWGGISSLQLRLPLVWTEGRRRGHGRPALARWLAEEPARLAGLDHRKGFLRPGADADLVIWDPDAEFDVDPHRLHHRHPVSPYADRKLAGVVEATILRGRVVYRRGGPVSDGSGILLTRRGAWATN